VAGTLTFDPAKVAAEAKWLIDNPQFEERPATIEEFLGTGYLDIAELVRPGIRDALVEIFGDDVSPKMISRVRRAMVTGAIGIGKTTFASIALPYMVHWVLCLRNPQGFFRLLPGSRIAFMQMSTSEKQASEVVFGDIFARVKHSQWFVEKYPYDEKFTKQIRFPKDIWILPGDSAETTFEGYNILGGILDEMDSHKTTKDKDYADVGYDTINSRIESRFGNQGLIICIGQMKKSNGFAATKYEEFLKDPEALVVRMTIWDSLGWDKFLKPDGTHDSFYYDAKRKSIIPQGLGQVLTEEGGNDNLFEVPVVYKKSFDNNPEKALRDLAGIPPAVSDPFISLVDRIEAARDRWVQNHKITTSPVGTNPTRPDIAPWFRATTPLKRVAHIDLAISADGDAAGIAMGHIRELVEVDGEIKPYVVIDCAMRIKAMPGTEIILSDIRRIIYDLRDERKFRLKTITMDGFQSTDTMQQLRKKRFFVDYLSVDKNKLPYEDLREALYDGRIEFPPFMTYLNKGDTSTVEIIIKELSELQDDGKKIDHPVKGSKDVSDAIAGVVSTLIGDRAYARGVPSPSRTTSRSESVDTSGFSIPSSGSSFGAGVSAPVPPSIASAGGIAIPSRLQPRRDR
jgi:hypothetical protein